MFLKLIGILLLGVSVIGGFILSGGNPIVLWHPPEAIIIIGGGLAAFIVSNTIESIKATGRAVARIFSTFTRGQDDTQKLLTLLYQLFEQRRRFGVAVLEEHIEAPGESSIFTESGVLQNERLTSFICDNLRLVTLGKVQAHELEGLLESEIDTMGDDLMRPSHTLQMVADALPGFGIVASVLGIVLTMGAMGGSAEVIGASIAKALVATFIGMTLSYGLVGPLAKAIEGNVREEIQLFSCVKSAILGMVSGRPSAIAVDAGRRVLFSEIRPSFEQMEGWLLENKTA